MSATALVAAVRRATRPSARHVGAAAQSLGANRLTAHLTVIIPLCRAGISQVFMLVYAASVSAFVIPLVLGRGQVAFLSNLVYARFSEVADFPGGAALSILLLLITLCVTLGLGWIVGNPAAKWRGYRS